MPEVKKISGIVKSIRKDKTAVCINFNDFEDGNALINEWFTLGEKVKPEYIKVGSNCEANVIDSASGNRIVIFIKCNGTQTQQTQPQTFKTADKIEPIKPDAIAISRMSAVKNASVIYQGTGKEKEMKRLTNEILQFLEDGVWTQKIENESEYL